MDPLRCLEEYERSMSDLLQHDFQKIKQSIKAAFEQKDSSSQNRRRRLEDEITYLRQHYIPIDRYRELERLYNDLLSQYKKLSSAHEATVNKWRSEKDAIKAWHIWYETRSRKRKHKAINNVLMGHEDGVELDQSKVMSEDVTSSEESFRMSRIGPLKENLSVDSLIALCPAERFEEDGPGCASKPGEKLTLATELVSRSISSSQSTVGDVESSELGHSTRSVVIGNLHIQSEMSDDLPIVVSERPVKRRRRATALKNPSTKDAKTAEIKLEPDVENSIELVSNQQFTGVGESLDLDEVGPRIRTPKKLRDFRRGLRVSSNSPSLSNESSRSSPKTTDIAELQLTRPAQENGPTKRIRKLFDTEEMNSRYMDNSPGLLGSHTYASLKTGSDCSSEPSENSTDARSFSREQRVLKQKITNKTLNRAGHVAPQVIISSVSKIIRRSRPIADLSEAGDVPESSIDEDSLESSTDTGNEKDVGNAPNMSTRLHTDPLTSLLDGEGRSKEPLPEIMSTKRFRKSDPLMSHDRVMKNNPPGRLDHVSTGQRGTKGSKNLLAVTQTCTPRSTPKTPRESSFSTESSTSAAKPTNQTVSSDERPISPGMEPFRARPLRRLGLDHFKINPEHNQGLDFAFTETVRNRDQRKCLSGCTKPGCCGDKFRRVLEIGGIPTPSRSGLQWRSQDEIEDQDLLEGYLGQERAQVEHSKEALAQEELLQAQTKKLANQFGKHRHAFERPKTPPGFWRAGMPSTQELDDDRKEALELERKKVEERYREAMRPGGKWIFRDE